MQSAVPWASLRAASLLCLVGALVIACGSVVSGTPVRQEADLSRLEVGNYPTVPRHLGTAKTLKQGRIRESQRLADYVALPFEADPSYTEDSTGGIQRHIVLDSKGMGNLVINDTFDDVAKDLVAGWVNRWDTGGPPEAPRRTLAIAVLEFPDAATASIVAATLEHDDFTYHSTNLPWYMADSEPVSFPKYQGTKAHWRPPTPALVSWTVRDRYVVFVKIIDDTAAPDLPALIGRTEHMLDVALPLLDQFRPTPADQLRSLALDPDDVLARTLATNPDFLWRPDPDGVFTGRGAVFGLESTNLDFLTTGDIDRIAFGDTTVFRSRSAAGARRIWQKWADELRTDQNRQMIDPPKGIDGEIVCARPNQQSQFDVFLCIFQVDRWTVQAPGRQSQDLFQKVSAQYALLTRR